MNKTIASIVAAASLAQVFATSVAAADLVTTYEEPDQRDGVNLGFTTRGRLVWAVFAPTAGYHRGSLGGLYQGITAEATLAGGVGANVLFGGTAGSIQLQTISVTGQLGLNVAATGTSVTLTPAG
jgi:opacity protein-like surface antigen